MIANIINSPCGNLNWEHVWISASHLFCSIIFCYIIIPHIYTYACKLICIFLKHVHDNVHYVSFGKLCIFIRVMHVWISRAILAYSFETNGEVSRPCWSIDCLTSAICKKHNIMVQRLCTKDVIAIVPTKSNFIWHRVMYGTGMFRAPLTNKIYYWTVRHDKNLDRFRISSIMGGVETAFGYQ